VTCSEHGTRRPDQRAVGPAGAAAAQGQEVRPAAEVEQTPAHQRDPLADPHRRAVAGHPTRYGPWQTVYGLFRRWQRDGTWQHILTQLQAQADAKGVITWEVRVDATVARAQQHAAGARKGGTGTAKHRAGSTTSRPTTRWGAPGVG
jgi:transposase